MEHLVDDQSTLLHVRHTPGGDQAGTDPEKLGGFIVGVDGRGHGGVAIETALSLLSEQLTLVQAWEPPAPRGATGYVPPCDDELAVSGRRAATELADALAASSVDETGVVVNPLMIRADLRLPRCSRRVDPRACWWSAEMGATASRAWVWDVWLVRCPPTRCAR